MRDYRSMKVPAEFIDKYIRPSCANDPAIVAAFEAVPREFFMDEAMRLKAYSDNALPIGYGQTISQPSLVAMMLHKLEPQKSMKCLEIGAGSGYVSAILGQLMSDVYAVELVPELVKTAQLRLRAMKLWNVKLMTANGALGYPEKAPYDRILVSAGANSLPQPLVDQLANGGIMIIPLNGVLTRLRKSEKGLSQEELAQVAFVNFVNT